METFYVLRPFFLTFPESLKNVPLMSVSFPLFEHQESQQRCFHPCPDVFNNKPDIFSSSVNIIASPPVFRWETIL